MASHAADGGRGDHLEGGKKEVCPAGALPGFPEKDQVEDETYLATSMWPEG